MASRRSHAHLLTINQVKDMFKRQVVDHASKRDGTETKIITAWFESSGTLRLTHPLDLAHHPDLQEGDLFYHALPGTTKNQVWMWTNSKEGETGRLQWRQIYWGHVRDGLYLTLTQSECKPSWVTEKRLRQRSRESK